MFLGEKSSPRAHLKSIGTIHTYIHILHYPPLILSRSLANYTVLILLFVFFFTLYRSFYIQEILYRNLFVLLKLFQQHSILLSNTIYCCMKNKRMKVTTFTSLLSWHLLPKILHETTWSIFSFFLHYLKIQDYIKR